MKWNDLHTGLLKEALAILEQVLHQAGIDYYLIGALARDVWYARSGKRFRETKDLDLAVFVGSKEQYEQLKQYLVVQNGFHRLQSNFFALRTPSNVTVDILPFGGMHIDDHVVTSSTAVTSLPVNAMYEVFLHGTATVEGGRGRSFKVATLPSIVLLKLIAFDDRPEMRSKDVEDIVHIINHYVHLERDFIYEHHNDLFDPDTTPFTWSDDNELAGIVIGREIARVIQGNPALLDRVKKILTGFIHQNEKSSFIREMSRVSGLPVDVMQEWLKNLHKAITS